LDKTTEIHTNNGDCKWLMHKELEKMWVEALVVYICLGRLKKTAIWKYYLRSLLDRRRKKHENGENSYLNQASCKIACEKKEIRKHSAVSRGCLLQEAENTVLSSVNCPAGWGQHEVTAGSWCLSWVSCARYASRAWLAHAPSRETDKRGSS